MTDAPVPDRRARLAGVVAGAAAVVAVAVAAVLALTAGGADRTAADGPTVAGATARAMTTPGPSATTTAGEPDAPADDPGQGSAGTVTGDGSGVPDPLRGTVDVVRELESGGPIAPVAGLGDDVEVLAGVRVAVTAVQRVDGQAAGPGEASGPALALDVRLVNDSGTAVSADGLVVNVYGTDAAPGSQLLGDPRSAPLQGDVAGGTSGRGVYVLTGPGGSTTGPHLVTVALGAGATTALVVLTPEAG